MVSSWTRDQIHVPCIGRHILIYWTTREVQKKKFIFRTLFARFIPLPHTQLQNVVPTLALENGTLRGFETDRLHSHSVHPGAPEARCLISASLGSLYIQIITEPAAHQVVGRLHLNNTIKCFMDYLHIVSLIKGQLLI